MSRVQLEPRRVVATRAAPEFPHPADPAPPAAQQAEQQFTAGPGALVWCPREQPHAFKVNSPRARALVIVTPAGFEEMFVAGGVPVSQSSTPPTHEYDPDVTRAIAEQFGFEVIGPQID